MNYMKLEMIEKEAFAGDYESVVLEQWKTCIAEANGISEKRNNSNNIFITLNTALFAVITFTLDYHHSGGSSSAAFRSAGRQGEAQRGFPCSPAT